MNKTFALLAALAIAVAIGVGPASAITDGVPDGNGHPYVGLMVAQDSHGNPLWRCSGTLLSPTVYLTAGHCTEAPAAHAEVFFAAHIGADPVILARALSRMHAESVGRWHRNLTPEQVAEVESEAAELMEELGYS